jgi:DNA-binding transcriptional regulator YiaG
MKTPPVEGWEPEKITYPVAIPTLDGKSVVRTVELEIDAWRNAAGEIFLDGDAEEKIEAVKARHMGLLTPGEIKEIRISKLKTTQKEISTWLQIGEKTWTRWESGRERPSRSMNVLLCALRDSKIDAPYLEHLRWGEKLASIWQQEPASLTNRPIVYEMPRQRAADVRSFVKSLDARARGAEKNQPSHLVRTKTDRRRRNVFVDTSALVSFAAVAKAHQRAGIAWAAAKSGRGTILSKPPVAIQIDQLLSA